MGIGFSLIWAVVAWAGTIGMGVPAGKIAKLRVYQTIEAKRVLVGVHLIPEGSRLTVTLEPLLYQRILNDKGKVVSSSMPYFPVRVDELPPDFPSEEAGQILGKDFFVHVMDLDSAQLVSTLYRDSLPKGVDRVDYPFAWNAFNPQGTWAYALQKALALKSNRFLLDSPPRDMEDFCPRFSGLNRNEREIFWIAFFNEVVRYESAFVPLTASDEGQYDSGNKGIISSGLTQVSLRSSQASCYQARGCSPVKNQDDLFDPAKNLQCAVGIMSCLSESAGCLSCKRGGKWKGIAAYWSTLRDPYQVNCPSCSTGKVTIGMKPQIREAMKTQAPFCY